jgi:hypothetical protein
MNKLFCTVFLGAGLILGASSAEAQHFYVSVHPAAAVVVRPAAPSPRHVWVASEWTWRGGSYVEVPGYWALPPAGHRNWVEGHWIKDHHGEYWVAGHWR